MCANVCLEAGLGVVKVRDERPRSSSAPTGATQSRGPTRKLLGLAGHDAEEPAPWYVAHYMCNLCVTITYHIADIRVRASSGPSLRGEDGFLVCALPQSSVVLRGTTMSRQISTIEATPPMLAWSCSSQPLWRRRATCGATSTWDLHC